MPDHEPFARIIILISANAEWQALSSLPGYRPPINRVHGRTNAGDTPFGEWFQKQIGGVSTIFVHGGWGKISAAASTQYVIDHYTPWLLVNLGTCGGFSGQVERGSILLVDSTLVYDIFEKMGDYEEALRYYTTELDLNWLGTGLPSGISRSLLVSADRDLLPEDIQRLKQRYGAIAGDWESGAINWVADRNHVPCLILRGVTDLVDEEGGEAYGNYDLFFRRTRDVMEKLTSSLPWFIERFLKSHSQSINQQ